MNATATATTTAPLPTVATDVCTNTACTTAYSPRDLCECSHCEAGAGHGLQYRIDAARGREQFRARSEKAGGVMALLASMGVGVDDDEPF